MSSIDEQLRSILNEHADDVSFAPQVVADAARRGRRQQLLTRTAGVAVVLIVVVVIGITAVVRATTQTQSLHTAKPNQQSGVLTLHSLPLTPGYVPSGLIGPYTSVYGGTTNEVRYVTRSGAVHAVSRACPDPTGRADDLFITTAASSDEMPFYPAIGTSTSINGNAAKLFDVAQKCRLVAVTFKRQDLWVTVTGEGRYASVAGVVRVTKSLQDRAVPATPPMRLDYLPRAYPVLQQYDRDSIVVTKHKGEDVFGTELKDGVIVSLSEASAGHPFVPAAGSNKLAVGSYVGWIEPKHVLLVHLSGRLWLEVIGRSLPTAELVRIATGVHVLPDARPLQDFLISRSLG